MTNKAPRVEVIPIEQLRFDDKNANTGTERGASMLETSLRTDGAGRGVLADKDNRLIAGNKTIEGAADIGIKEAIVVDTRGDQIVVTRRVDVSLDDPRGRRLAIADNRVNEVNLAWEPSALRALSEQIDMKKYFSEAEFALISTLDTPIGGGMDGDLSINSQYKDLANVERKAIGLHWGDINLPIPRDLYERVKARLEGSGNAPEALIAMFKGWLDRA